MDIERTLGIPGPFGADRQRDLARGAQPPELSLLEIRELTAGADLRAVLEATRTERIAAGWGC